MLKRATGVQGAARKYDILTALGAWGLAQDKSAQRLALRLICLITARYNWQQDHLSVGQTEIARIWQVDVRTVKREMAVLRQRGWLVEKQGAARGRVAVHSLKIDKILHDTRDAWGNVGPDLAERLSPAEPQTAPVTPDKNVIAFPQPALPAGDSPWARVARSLAQEDPALWRSWFAALEPVEEGRDLVLRAPSGFHASYVQTHFLARLEARAGRNVRLIFPAGKG